RRRVRAERLVADLAAGRNRGSRGRGGDRGGTLGTSARRPYQPQVAERRTARRLDWCHRHGRRPAQPQMARARHLGRPVRINRPALGLSDRGQRPRPLPRRLHGLPDRTTSPGDPGAGTIDAGVTGALILYGAPHATSTAGELISPALVLLIPLIAGSIA